ncbi:MAG: hypothetical protein IJU23_00940 [Proteobacteria bacterium]|nr:hypothetical protein [Pseudomonadota bacterium]
MIIDLFTYTNATSNAPFSLETLIEAARCARLDGIAVTDRASSSRAREYADIAAREQFFVAVGIELKTSAGIVAAYPANLDDEFVNEGWRSLGDMPEVEDVLEYFHERGGIVIARDVYNRGDGMKDRVYAARDSKGHGFDAIDTVAVYRRRIDNELSIEAQQVLGIAACAGSGVFSDLQDIGHCATLFAADIHDQASFVSALKSPLHWACALRDLGDACPMGSAPAVEDHERRYEDRRNSSDRRGGDRRRDDRRGDDRRGGDRRRDDRRGGERRCDDRRRDDRRGGDRRRDDRRGGDARRGSGNRRNSRPR